MKLLSKKNSIGYFKEKSIYLFNKEIYYFVDKESMFLLIFGLILTILSFYQNNRKVVKNKFVYIIPSLMGILLYIYYIAINV